MSYIQLPYGFVKNNKQIQFNLPSDFEESQYYGEVPFITNESPTVKNKLLNLLRNREDLKKWLLATSDYENETQEDLNAIVGYNDCQTWLDLKDEVIFRNPNPINVTFHDMKKFDLVNPVIDKLASQVRASKLTDYELTKKLLEQGEIDKLHLRLDALKYGINKDDNEIGRTGRGGGGGGNDDDDETPGPDLWRKTPKQEMDEIVRRLNFLRGNAPISRYLQLSTSTPIRDEETPRHFLEPQEPRELSFLIFCWK